MRNRFEEKLSILNDTLIEMGALIEKAIKDSILALRECDLNLAKKTIALDEEINQIEKEIESQCMKLLLQQQPVARDLRLISAALKIITDMERIGDQSADIAKRTIELKNIAELKYIKNLSIIPKMGEITADMVTKSIDSFVKRDISLAENVIETDIQVNRLFKEAKQKIIDIIHEDKNDGEEAVELLMVAKYFERIGDHATNIAEWVIFSITGAHRDVSVF